MAWPNARNAANTDKTVGNPANDETPDYTIADPHRPAGVVFPYRGQEQHGVAVDAPPYQRGPDVTEYREAEIALPEELPEPIAVRVVTEDSREIRAFSATQTIVDNNVRIIAGANERRKRITIRNMDAAKTIYIGHDLTLTPTTGYPIFFGASHTLESCETAIYGISADGTQVAIALIQERTVASD